MLAPPAPGVGYGGYTLEHVDRLHRMVDESLGHPFKFVCLRGLLRYPGWWAKLQLFESGRFEGRVLYLDLDVCVVGGLDSLVEYDARFAAPRDPLYLGLNSSVMMWDADAPGLERIASGPPREWSQMRHGDQRWINHCVRDVVRFFPREWCTSYKAGLAYGQWPGDQRVVYFHGQPKPWDVERPYPWEGDDVSE